MVPLKLLVAKVAVTVVRFRAGAVRPLRSPRDRTAELVTERVLPGPRYAKRNRLGSGGRRRRGGRRWGGWCRRRRPGRGRRRPRSRCGLGRRGGGHRGAALADREGALRSQVGPGAAVPVGEPVR